MAQFQLASIELPDLQLASLAPELKTIIFLTCATAAAGLLIFLLIRRMPNQDGSLRSVVQQLLQSLSGGKREARLHKVICYHCNKGMGLYNPVYVTIEGVSYIEGTCNTCGNFVRARLR